MARVRTSAGEPTGTAPAPKSEERALVPASRGPKAEAAKGARPRAAGVAKRKPAPEPMTRRLPAEVRQVGLIVGLAGCVFVMVALGSYDSGDVSLSVAGTGQAHNWVGRVGSYLSDILYQGLGYSAWAVVLLATFLALRLAGRAVGGWGSALVSLVGLVALAGALDLAIGRADASFPPGGMVGLLVVDAVRPHMSDLGTALVLGTGLVAAATLLFGINWQPIAARAVDGVQTGAPAAARAVGAAGVGALKATARIGGAGVVALRDRLRGGGDEDEEDEEEGTDEEWDDRTSAEEPSLSDPRVPAALPLPAPAVVADPRPTRAPLPEASPPPAVLSPRGAPPAVFPPTSDPPSRAPAVIGPRSAQIRALHDPDRDAPTQHAGRTLVEVEWTGEGTSHPARGAPRGLADVLRTAEPSVRPAEPSARPTEARLAPPVSRPTVAEPPRFEPLRPEPLRSEPLAVDRVPPPAPAPWDEPEEPSVSVAPPAAPRPSAPPPSALTAAPPPAEARAIFPPQVVDDLDEVAPAPARPRPKVGYASDAAVVPGNLRSGGKTDDGKPIRKAASPIQLPPLSLLDEHPAIVAGTDESVLLDLARRLTTKLLDFGVEGRVSAIRPGPVITLFEYEPAPGVKLSRIASLSDDLAMALKALSVRIVAPIPGRGVVGIEIPNEKRQTVWARDVFASTEFRDVQRILPLVLGKDTEGRPYVGDLAKMPHLLIGGTTGSGKSVGVNSMLVSLLFQRTPEELRLILVDPKMLEFELYQDIPHLLHPVVTEAKLASAVLKWACVEMDERYRMLARWQTRNIEGYNEKVINELRDWTPEKARRFAPKDWPEGDLLPLPKKLPYIVIVIDELADLMMVAAKDVEESIVRLAQKARACGIHLIVATQRPSVDVITGLIKANMPSRIAYQVRSKTDGRTILDQNGAETLLGKGDLLLLPPGTAGLVRIHGPFLTDDEVRRVSEFLKAQAPPDYAPRITLEDSAEGGEDLSEEMDENYDRAVEFALEKGRISTSMIQRLLKIGYNRAARIMEIMEREGVVGPADGAKPREVLVQR